MFHVGVEVYGWEWSYGYVPGGMRRSGVFVCAPKVTRQGYRQSIALGRTCLSMAQVRDLVHSMRKEWLGEHYDPLRHNCGHFSEAFAGKLCVEPLPHWVVNLAEAGSAVKRAFDNLRKAGNLVEAALIVAAAKAGSQP